ncbi:hypothetical protein [Massilia frigida]|uniref:hypothetical protein n=1 Tax=Massilia frigida TaxID=2609281 RepID=UPI001E4B18C8|nr:hypothetical protein [Massilia frigida]
MHVGRSAPFFTFLLSSVPADGGRLALSALTLHRRLRLRLHRQAACRLLACPAMTVKRAASQSGFGTEYNLRRALAAQLGVVPGDDQVRFG